MNLVLTDVTAWTIYYHLLLRQSPLQDSDIAKHLDSLRTASLAASAMSRRCLGPCGAETSVQVSLPPVGCGSGANALDIVILRVKRLRQLQSPNANEKE